MYFCAGNILASTSQQSTIDNGLQQSGESGFSANSVKTEEEIQAEEELAERVSTQYVYYTVVIASSPKKPMHFTG